MRNIPQNNERIHYYLHVRKQRSLATRHFKDLKKQLKRESYATISIGVAVARALVWEYEGDWDRALKYRKKQLELIHRLYRSFRLQTNEEALSMGLCLFMRRNLLAVFHGIQKTYKEYATTRQARSLTSIVGKIKTLPVLPRRIQKKALIWLSFVHWTLARTEIDREAFRASVGLKRIPNRLRIIKGKLSL